MFNIANNAEVQNEYILRRFLEQLTYYPQFHGLALPGTVPMGAGNEMRWLYAPAIAADTTALTETSTSGNELTSYSLTAISGAMKEYGKWMKIGKQQKDTMVPGTLDQIARRFAEWGGATIDELLYAQAKTSTKYMKAGATAANTGTITSASTPKATDFHKIVAYYEGINAVPYSDLGDQYAALLHPNQISQLKAQAAVSGEPTWSTYNVADGKLAFEGPIRGRAGSLGGVALHSCSIIDKVLVDSVSGYQGVVLAPEGLGTASLEEIDPEIIRKTSDNPYDTSQPIPRYDTLACYFRGAFKVLQGDLVLSYYSYTV